MRNVKELALPTQQRLLTASRPRQTAPTLIWERRFWRDGLDVVAGVDEVGRGALAGPLVAAAVVFPACTEQAFRALRSTLRGVADSKRLDPTARSRLAARIEQVAVSISIGAVSSWELDAVGLSAANRMAMERAVWGLALPPDAILLDACTVDHAVPQVGLIRGDAISLSIAAASIVAKVTRDQLMDDLEEISAPYGFAAHKGYGTRQHLAALERFGPGPFHRRSFAPVALLT